MSNKKALGRGKAKTHFQCERVPAGKRPAMAPAEAFCTVSGEGAGVVIPQLPPPIPAQEAELKATTWKRHGWFRI